jgi:hypothetical protein
MSNAFQQIFNDTMENSPVDVNLPTLPDVNNLNITDQIKILYHGVQRSLTFRKRIESLYYIYKIGFIIVANDLKRRETKLSNYYYTAAKRCYYLFENNVDQIMRTKVTTIRLIERLKHHEWMSLMDLI